MATRAVKSIVSWIVRKVLYREIGQTNDKTTSVGRRGL